MNASSSDLKPLRRIIGNARIVMFGEGQHFAAEPLEFRNRLFKYLVEDLGFEAIALESGVTEGRLVHDYVLGTPGDLDAILSQGLSWSFDLLPQNKQLIAWMREYNADPKHSHKLEFFGYDVSGSPTVLQATRNADTALNEAIRYLQSVDSPAADAINSRLKSIIPTLKWSVGDYLAFPSSTRDALTVIVADVVSGMEARQLTYIDKSSKEEYEWGKRNALVARQVDDSMRRIPLDAKGRDYKSYIGELFAVRDHGMLENARWIIDRLGPNTKILFFAALAHIANAPYVEDDGPHVPFGAYMKRHYGNEIVTIGNLAAGGRIGGCPRTFDLKPTPSTAVNARFAELNEPLYLLDMRDAPTSITWLREPNELWYGGPSNTMVLTKAFDVLFFSANFSPACKTIQ